MITITCVQHGMKFLLSDLPAGGHITSATRYKGVQPVTDSTV